jgi:hypothetical protein
MKLNVNNILVFLLFCCFCLFPVNYSFIFSLRVMDLLFITLFFLFLLTNPTFDYIVLMVVLLIFCILLFSSFLGLGISTEINYERFGFIYKYFFLFAMPWVVKSIIKTKKQLKTAYFLLLTSFIFMCSWSYFYLLLVYFDMIEGGIRLSYPFSSDYFVSDAHLYSSFIGFFTVAYLIFLRPFFSHRLLLSFCITTNAFIALLLAGSRTGILIVAVSIMLISSYKILIFLSRSRYFVSLRSLFFLTLGTLVLLISSHYIVQFSSYTSDYDYLIERSLNFDLFNDYSSSLRVKMLNISLVESEYSLWMFGSGFFSRYKWYDGILSILVAHGGFPLVLMFVILVFIFWFKSLLTFSNSHKVLVFTLLVLIYVIANVITEHAFISRNAFPIISFLTLYFNFSNFDSRNIA